MKAFFEKINKNVLAIISFVICGFCFLTGILNISAYGSNVVGSFINDLIATVVFAGLGVCLLLEKKDKIAIFVVLAIGSVIFSAFGNSIDSFVSGIDTLRAAQGNASFVMMGLSVLFVAIGTLSLFVAVVCHIIPKILVKAPKEVLTLVGTICYLITAGCAVTAAVLYLFGTSESMNKTVCFFNDFTIAGEAFLLAGLMNKDY